MRLRVGGYAFAGGRMFAPFQVAAEQAALQLTWEGRELQARGLGNHLARGHLQSIEVLA